MTYRWTAVVLLFAGALTVLITACADDHNAQSRSATPAATTPSALSAAATPTDTAAPTPTPVATGIPPVDRVLAALQSAPALAALFAPAALPCRDPAATGIGGPPTCPAGVNPGSAIDALPASDCEEAYLTPPGFDRAAQDLVAAHFVPSAVTRAGNGYALVLVDPSGIPTTLTLAASGAVTRIKRACGESLGEVLAASGGEVIWRAK